MTVRAVLLGLLGAAAICAFGFFNDMMMRGTFLVGNYMPISVYGLLILFLLIVNPLLFLTGRLRSHLLARVMAGAASGALVGLIAGLAAGWITGLAAALVAGTAVWFATGLVVAFAPEPFTGLVGALAGALAGGLAAGLFVGPLPGLLAGLAAGLFAGLAAGRRALSGRELAVIVALVLPACYVPGRGLMHYFTTVLMLPHHYERTDPGWEEQGVVKMVPEVMLAGVSPRLREDDILDPRGVARALVSRGEGGGPPSPRLRTAKPSVASAEEGGGEGDPGRRIWDRLAPRDREAIRAALLAPDPEDACRGALVRALNGVLDRRDLYHAPDFENVILPEEASQLLEIGVDSLPENTRDEKARRLNRHLIDSAYPKQITGLVSKKDDAVNGFVRGLGIGTGDISLSQIPWYAWTGTLFRFWLPLLLAFSFAVMGLAVVVHRQWSDHEHLPYPIVTFAQSLLPAEGESRGGVFRNRMFWIAAATIMFVHLNNYAYRWWPEHLVEIPRYFDFRSLARLFPTLRRGGVGHIFNPTIYFTAIGFAYFVASDVSLSLGLAPFVYAWVAGLFAGYGVSFAGGHISTRIMGSLFAGAYFGMFLFLVYTGRRYYATVFRRGLWLPARDEAEPSAVWGARVFMVGAGLFVLRLVLAGLGWQWAVLYTVAAVMLFLVMSRVVAETGMFFIHAYWYPGVLLWTFLGAKALGPQTMLIMFLVSCVLLIDPREAVMPFAVHGLKLADANRARVGRTALWGGVALVIGFAAALPVVLYLQYKQGATAVGDGWTLNVPRFSFNAVVSAKQRLAAQGALEEAGTLSGLAWFKSVAPNTNCVIAFFAAVGLVLLFAAARLRFPRWPLHPVMFVALGTWQARCLAVSFLIGWLIKVTVTKYGGAAVYRRMKPLMIGIIAGDMLGGVIPMIVGAIYYFATDEIPKGFRVLPT